MKFQIFVYSVNIFLLKTYINYITSTFLKKKSILNVQFFPVSKKRVTLIKSPHVYKKSKDQFEIKSFKARCVFEFEGSSELVFSFFILNKPKSIVLKFISER